MRHVISRIRPARAVSLVAMALVIALPSIPVSAQETLAETRIRKMESEIRALQRKVFPGGDNRFFQPEITSPGTAAGTAPPPSTTAVTDILSRMDSLEAQIAQLTSQIEQNSNRISQLETRAGITTQTATDASAVAPTATPTPAPTPTPTPTPAASQSNLDAMTGGASASATSTPAASPPSSRVSAVSAIVKPQTDDAADDEYSYGFRLWDADFHPEAQQQLKLFVDKYPSHWRISWGRNLLGRAYLDDGNAREAAKWFLQNYQADKSGGRAPDSLLYLGVSMKKLGDTTRACIALAEFSETYAAESAGRLKSVYDATRNGLSCSG